MVSPGTSSRHWASANVVVPDAIATAVFGPDQGRRRAGDRVLLRALEDELVLEAGLMTSMRARQHRAAVDLLHQSVLGQHLEIAPDRHVRDAELLR